jgi:hypothetical protein
MVYGAPLGTNYTLDVFFDHLCPNSAAAFSGLFLYYSNNQHWLRMVIHIVPQSFYTYTFYVSQAGRYVQLENPFNFTSYLSWMFQHQTKYTDAAQQWELDQLFYFLSVDTQTATGLNATLVQEALNNTDYNWDVRLSWKYAMSKGISVTPMYMLNGVIVPQMTAFRTFQDWQTYFNGISNN